MKKLLLLSACLMLAVPAWAQRGKECALSPLQDLLVNIRTPELLQNVINSGRPLDENTCGGSLMELAIRRGNPEVLAVLLNQDPKRANEIVSLATFPIAGAPKRTPIILFAAYYAPNKEMVELLGQAGANIAATDEYGRNILWYLDKNPVLRNTELSESLENSLLFGQGYVPTVQTQSAQPAQPIPAQPVSAPVQQGLPAQRQNPATGLVREY